MSTRRLAILLALMARLEVIKQSNGFETDAGFTVILGERTEFGAEDPDSAIAVVVFNDVVQHVGENVAMSIPIEFQAITKVNINAPLIAAEHILGDIKRAIELPDRTLGGLVPRFIKRGSTRVLPRELGSTTVGVGVLYVVPTEEAWGAP